MKIKRAVCTSHCSLFVRIDLLKKDRKDSMTIFYTLVPMILTIVVANLLSQVMPRIPKAFWQILGGIILATIPVLSKSVVELDPEWFMKVNELMSVWCQRISGQLST